MMNPVLLCADEPAKVTDESTLYVAIFALLVSIVSALVAILSVLNQRRMVAMQVRNSIIDWANEAVNAIQDCIDYCKNPPATPPGTSPGALLPGTVERQGRLSELIDRGRWFFPNIKTGFGPSKLEANQGITQPPVTHLKKALARFNPTPATYASVEANLVKSKREFVNAVYKALPLQPTTRKRRTQ